MKFQGSKHAEEPAQENNNYSKYKMVLGFELYLMFDSIPYSLSTFRNRGSDGKCSIS